jgi:antitoxin (DNA-binding transcriptional repressor) of toxin-antitoxin stability system
MTYIPIENLPSPLVDLIKELRRGGDILFTECDQPIARLVPFAARRQPRKAGSAKHLPHFMADDFDATPEGFEEYMP